MKDHSDKQAEEIQYLKTCLDLGMLAEEAFRDKSKEILDREPKQPEISDWRKECAVMNYADGQKVYMFTHRAGRMAYQLALMDMYPRAKVVVCNLNTLDVLVRSGIQPSRIMVAGEQPTHTFDSRMFDFLWE